MILVKTIGRIKNNALLEMGRIFTRMVKAGLLTFGGLLHPIKVKLSPTNVQRRHGMSLHHVSCLNLIWITSFHR